MHCDCITIFNYHKLSDKWYPTLIHGVDFGNVSSSKNSTRGTDDESSVVFIIKCNQCRQVITHSGAKRYIGAKEYARCSNPHGYFTFDTEKDFVYRGIWNGEMVINEDDYECGFYSYMNSEFDDVYKITSSEFYSLLPHFEVSGR